MSGARQVPARMQGRYVTMQKAVGWAAFLVMSAVAANRVFSLPLNLDVAGFLLDARAFEMGRSLFESFFEQNTPTNVWLPVLALKLSHVTSLLMGDIFQGLLFAFGLGCAALAVYLVHWLLEAEHPITTIAASVVIPGVLLWFPHFEFGQREPLLACALAPYLVLLIARARGRAPSLGVALLVGAIAAFGISLKPYFFLFAGGYAFLELCFRRGRLREIGAETYCMAGCLAAFLVWLVVLCPLYFTDMVPMATATYLPLVRPLSFVWQVWGVTRNGIVVAFALAIVGLCLWRRRPAPGAGDWYVLVLWLATFAMAFALYLGQKQGFRYHQLVIIPLLVTSCALAPAFLLDDLAKSALPRFAWLRLWPATAVLTVACIAGGAGVSAYLNTTYIPFQTRQQVVNDPMTVSLRSLPAGTPVLAFMSGIPPMSPLHAYANNIRWTGEFSTLFPMRAIIGEHDLARAQSRPVDPTVSKAEALLRRFVLNSFKGVPPQYVYVDVSPRLRWFEDYGKPVSIIAFLSEQPEFAAEWKNYEKIGELVAIFELKVDVYRRRKDAQ